MRTDDTAAHTLADLSPDDNGKWWWACSCDAAAGGYASADAAREDFMAHHPKATDLEVGSPAWLLRRKVLWDQHARDLMASLVKYEDEHPDNAICLQPVLDLAREVVPRA